MRAPRSPAAPVHPDEAAIGQALTRAAIYRVLGTAFTPPSTAAVAAVAEAAEHTAPVAPPGVAEGLRDVAAAARASAPDDLAGAYGSALERPQACSPYESGYGAAPLLAGKGAGLADIAGFYAAFGMMPGAAEIEDHIAAELEFMSVLALKEAAALAAGLAEGAEITRAAEVAFLADHLGRWGASFARALGARSPGPYYEKAAGLLATWLAEDMGALGVEAAPLEAREGADREEAGAFTCPRAGPGDGE